MFCRLFLLLFVVVTSDARRSDLFRESSGWDCTLTLPCPKGEYCDYLRGYIGRCETIPKTSDDYGGVRQCGFDIPCPIGYHCKYNNDIHFIGVCEKRKHVLSQHPFDVNPRW